jgi:hypothetical protein
MKLVHFINTNSNYIIPIVLFLGSFLIYSYNLEGQPWHGDEVVYLSWAGNYIHLIMKGDFANPCLVSLDNCHLLYHIPAYGLTYSPIRNLLIGFPMDVRNEDSGYFNIWACYWQCANHTNLPTVQEFTAGRLLSPLFGSLTVVISFLIGKFFFNKHIGIIFSLLFLFYDLWLWYSRSVMTEVHYVFFSMLSLLLLLYAFKTGHLKIRYLILSAIAFGFGFTSKMLSVEFSGLFLGIILFGGMFKRDTSSTLGKVCIPKICLSVFLFIIITGLSFFLTLPGFYENPLHQIAVTKSDMDNYNRDVWYIGYPTIHGIQIKNMITVFHYVLFPSFMETQILEPTSNQFGNFSLISPLTYSSVPLSIFFFIGLGYLIYRVRKFKNYARDGVVLIWFISTFIFTLLIAKDFSQERYLLPLLISIIFIASYGFWNFINGITYHKTKIAFTVCFVFAHSVTALLDWQKFYFSPGVVWTSPLTFGTLQGSLDNPFTFAVNATFVGFLLFMVIILFRERIHKPKGDRKKNQENLSTR